MQIGNGLSPPYLQDLFRQIKTSSTYSLRSAVEATIFLVYVYGIAYHLISIRVKVLEISKKHARKICLIVKILHFKANMKSYIQLETAAIFFLANQFLNQGIGKVYVMVDFICTG